MAHISAFRNGLLLSAFCLIVTFCVLPAGGEQQKPESPLTLAEIGAVDLL